jgi:tetratricopeptide (TPR) repeat protein
VLCKKIKRRGGAEQYHADKKCEEAIAVAAEACAEDTAGQTCYICTQAVHWKTKEGLVRMCACRGTAGFAHVSCLAEQAKILNDEAEANNLGDKAQIESWGKWQECSLCEQQYVGVVRCALGWACWKTYANRNGQTDRHWKAMAQLAIGLKQAGLYDEAAPIYESLLAFQLQHPHLEENVYTTQSWLANCYMHLGRLEESLELNQKARDGCAKLYGPSSERTLQMIESMSTILVQLDRHAEAKSLLQTAIPVAVRNCRPNSDTLLLLRHVLAVAISGLPMGKSSRGGPPAGSLERRCADVREAERIIDDVVNKSRQLLGGAHKFTKMFENTASNIRNFLGICEMLKAQGYR